MVKMFGKLMFLVVAAVLASENVFAEDPRFALADKCVGEMAIKPYLVKKTQLEIKAQIAELSALASKHMGTTIDFRDDRKIHDFVWGLRAVGYPGITTDIYLSIKSLLRYNSGDASTFKLCVSLQDSEALKKNPAIIALKEGKLKSLRVQQAEKEALAKKEAKEAADKARIEKKAQTEQQTAGKRVKEKMTSAEKLRATYNQRQIDLMADIVVKLKLHLESPKVHIETLDGQDNVVDTIQLEPMEKFRFAIKALRKDIRLLAMNPEFTGAADPDYEDIITSAFENRIVSAEELQQLASLKEIWDPKKRISDKAMFWIKAFGSGVGTVLPAPFGFVPALAVVVIERMANKKPKDIDPSDSLF